MTEAWWVAQHDGKSEPKESKYPELDFLDNEDTAPAYNAHTDPDMDGDGVLDGDDDNDHDGLQQLTSFRGAGVPATGSPAPHDDDGKSPRSAANPWAYTHPFNPCQAL